MSLVVLSDVQVLEPVAPFLSPFQFKISIDLVEELEQDVEFKLVYIVSADQPNLDQELESIEVGPIPVGTSSFVFEAPAPSTELIPPEDALGVTVILLSCSYRGQEFVSVGYYVNNEYTDEQLKESPPSRPNYEKLQRTILFDKPKVTKKQIAWAPNAANLFSEFDAENERCNQDLNESEEEMAWDPYLKDRSGQPSAQASSAAASDVANAERDQDMGDDDDDDDGDDDDGGDDDESDGDDGDDANPDMEEDLGDEDDDGGDEEDEAAAL
ncbi:ASF1 like histone chaperone-domain-containing protein [Polychytrium aggregatum]|uniref:ASF1 like histone chaperone-domain-containing protein n=1 Tax=Polychytrium aggregatum TaxID=110093 RepID=UPI0022FF3884|nr:ASF1 like histone chaperone-domain-containing protein [Polychytrium aggregatum]KAI9197425.1 ASF1 like histone chaperone-domain-containing protein [Polychytrium aggregatum]